MHYNQNQNKTLEYLRNDLNEFLKDIDQETEAVPEDESNLCYMAAKLFFDYYKLDYGIENYTDNGEKDGTFRMTHQLISYGNPNQPCLHQAPRRRATRCTHGSSSIA